MSIVDAQHGETVEGNLVNERQKTFIEPLHGLMEVHVLLIDIGDHRDDRRQEQKAAVAFIRFRDQNFSLTHLRIGAEHAHSAADHHGRIEPSRAQHGGDHRGRCGFSVAAGHRDAVFHAHELG